VHAWRLFHEYRSVACPFLRIGILFSLLERLLEYREAWEGALCVMRGDKPKYYIIRVAGGFYHGRSLAGPGALVRKVEDRRKESYAVGISTLLFCTCALAFVRRLGYGCSYGCPVYNL